MVSSHDPQIKVDKTTLMLIHKFMGKKILLTLVIFLASVTVVFADFNFTTSIAQISDTDSLDVDVTINLSASSADKTYYLRGAFYKSGSTQYFGFTQNNSGTYYNGPYSSDCDQLYKITTDANGDWQGTIKAKPDASDSGFEGTGDYLFKVGRYTESCNLTWADSNPINIQIQATATPTPEPTPDEPSPTATPTPSPTPKPTPTPTPKATPKSSLAATKSASPSASPQVLGEQTRSLIASGAGLMDTESPASTAFQGAPSKKVAGILIVSGAALILFALGFHLWYRKINKGKLLETKDPFQL